jgi:hypothetical protein
LRDRLLSGLSIDNYGHSTLVAEIAAPQPLILQGLATWGVLAL